MPDIPGLPEPLAAAKGVQMHAPPAHLLPAVEGVIGKAVAQLKEGERGKVVWIAQRQGSENSVNVAVVNKFAEGFEVVAWIGKEWGTPTSAGLAVGTAGTISWR